MHHALPRMSRKQVTVMSSTSMRRCVAREKRLYVVGVGALCFSLFSIWIASSNLSKKPLISAAGSLTGLSQSSILVMQYQAWAETADLLEELWLIPTLFEKVTGRRMVPLPIWLPQSIQLSMAYVVIASKFGDRDEMTYYMEQHPTAIWIFVAGENLYGSVWDNHVVGKVDLSLGHRSDITHESYMRLPWWFHHAIVRNGDACGTFHPDLLAHSNVEAWAARPKFAALLSHHYKYPRPQLFEALSAIQKVDCPSTAFHNMEWPSDLPNTHEEGTVPFLRNYRFNICPENSVSPNASRPGYNTEKVAHALLAGSVPIYWGDSFDPDVWNQQRLLTFEGNMTQLLESVIKLETDIEARNQFFQQPILQPGAATWHSEFCTQLTAQIRRVATKLSRHSRHIKTS
jgi:hypothetical protein